MQITDHAEIGRAANIKVSNTTPIVSFSPVVLACPDRKVDLQVRITAPSTGTDLPLVLLSHGAGPSYHLSSLEGYAPLAEFLAGHGFAVFQPTHLNSRHLGLQTSPDSIRDHYLDTRAGDMTRLLDRLEELEAAVPFIKGRLDPAKVAAVGHSLGALTVSTLIGATNRDPRDGTVSQLADKRITAAVIIGGTGHGADLSESGKALMPFYNIDFSDMHPPALVMWGEEDVGPHLAVRGADWHLDPYTAAPGPKDAFMVAGGKHGFGGISGWDAKECQDEDPERLAAVLRLTWAYLRSQLYKGDQSWTEACQVLQGLEHIGRIESKNRLEHIGREQDS